MRRIESPAAPWIYAMELFLFVSAAASWPRTAGAQTPSLSQPQKEVWGVVEQVWQLAEEQRLDDVLAHYHPTGNGGATTSRTCGTAVT